MNKETKKWRLCCGCCCVCSRARVETAMPRGGTNQINLEGASRLWRSPCQSLCIFLGVFVLSRCEEKFAKSKTNTNQWGDYVLTSFLYWKERECWCLWFERTATVATSFSVLCVLLTVIIIALTYSETTVTKVIVAPFSRDRKLPQPTSHYGMVPSQIIGSHQSFSKQHIRRNHTITHTLYYFWFFLSGVPVLRSVANARTRANEVMASCHSLRGSGILVESYPMDQVGLLSR